MNYRIGIDVGGTNTDAALLDEQLDVVHSVKVATTADVQAGVHKAVVTLLKESGVDPQSVAYAMLGTTHCTNAIVERKNLNSVALIRIGKPSTTAIPPLVDWPEDFKAGAEIYATLVSGGFEFDGQVLEALNRDEIVAFCKEIRGKVESVAISGVFSPVNKSHEEQVATWVKEELGDLPISLSSEIGSIGLLERENAAILNAALSTTCKTVAYGFQHALQQMGMHCRIFFSQNDGTLMSLAHTLKYPIFTIGCGITNSIRGASFLSRVKEAVILDIGGTTTDIGVLQNGFPRESAVAANIGGIQTNFRMPDMISIGVAGGTIVADDLTVGPQSVGYRITQKARIFGGDTITLSDIATKKNGAFPEYYDKVEALDDGFCEAAFLKVKQALEDGIDQMKTQKEDVVVVLTGGGSVICPDRLQGVSQIIRPAHYKSANAVGAALGQVSGEVERVFNLDRMTRKEALEQAYQEAKEKAVDSGAEEASIATLSCEDIPLAYLPGNAILIKVKVIGDLCH